MKPSPNPSLSQLPMKMVAEDYNAWLASVVECSEPCATPVAQFPNCTFVPKSENFEDSSQDKLSPSPSPSQAPVIFMVSPPGSLTSGDNEEGAVFLTPPEHHSHSQLSSSEDQNPNEAGRTAKRARTEVVEVDDTEVMCVERAASVDELVEEIEELGGVDGRCEVEGRRLPASLTGKGEEKEKGKEKEKDVVESCEKKSVLFEFLDVLKVVLGDADSGNDDDVDFLETAKRRGMKFPKPRWWP